MYQRFIQKSIENWLFKSKVIIIYGPRQSGKTTLSEVVLKKFDDDGLYLNCEVDSVRKELSKVEPAQLRNFFGRKKIVVLDEAQIIPNIGLLPIIQPGSEKHGSVTNGWCERVPEGTKQSADAFKHRLIYSSLGGAVGP